MLRVSGPPAAEIASCTACSVVPAIRHRVCATTITRSTPSR